MNSGFEIFHIAFLSVTLFDLLDILVISYILYQLYNFIRGTRAAQMAIGLCLIFVVSLLAQLLNMSGMSWIFQKLETIWLIIFVILFHPELRRMLVNLGQSPVIRYFVKSADTRVVDEIIKAVRELARMRHGALIVLVRNQSIKYVIETGIRLQAEVAAPLLLALFSPKSPLHDGAIIIADDEIVAAKAILPLSDSDRLDKRYGTRHRAALGLAEESDAFTVVVSEETGKISCAKDGDLLRDLSIDELEGLLISALNLRSGEENGKLTYSSAQNTFAAVE